MQMAIRKKYVVRFILCFTFFLAMQFINSDWSSETPEAVARKVAYSVLATSVYLLLISFIDKRNER